MAVQVWNIKNQVISPEGVSMFRLTFRTTSGLQADQTTMLTPLLREHHQRGFQRACLYSSNKCDP